MSLLNCVLIGEGSPEFFGRPFLLFVEGMGCLEKQITIHDDQRDSEESVC